MVANDTAQPNPTQPGLDNQPQSVLAELWRAYQDDVGACVSAASPVRDEAEPVRWDCTGIDHLGLRAIVRVWHTTPAAPVETIWLKNYPGLRAAIPARGLTRRPGFDGDRTIGDDKLCREFVLTIHGRGRGLRERGRAIVRELCEARSLGARFFERKDAAHSSPERFTPAQRSALTRNKLSATQWRILETLAFARGKMGKLGLWGDCETWGRIFGCDERTVRRSMAGLEALGLAWRHYTPTEGTAGRRVDQAPNLILPGPTWLRVDVLWTGSGDALANAHDHWGDVHRKRNAEHRRRQQHVRAVRRAHAAGEPVPVPPGGYPLEFEDWAAERLRAADTVAGVGERVETLDRRAAEIATTDAQAIAKGDVTPLTAFTAGQERREVERYALAERRREAMQGTDANAMTHTKDDLSPLRGLNRTELYQVGQRAKRSPDPESLYSRKWADNLAVPPQAVRPGQKGEPAHADGSRVVALRDALARRFGTGVCKDRGWGDWGDGGDMESPHKDPEPISAPLSRNRVEQASERQSQSAPGQRSGAVVSPEVHHGFTNPHRGENRASAELLESRGSPGGVPNHPAPDAVDGIPTTADRAGRKTTHVDLVRGHSDGLVDGIPSVDMRAELVLAAESGNEFAALFFGAKPTTENKRDKQS